MKVDGIDAEFEAAPIDRLRIYGGFTVLRSKFGSFANSLFYYPSPATCTVPPPGASGPGVQPGHSTGTPTSGGLTVCFGDATGLRTPFAPNLTANLGASYSVRLSDTSDLNFNILYAYNDGFFL